jgi:hypothetical protein
MAKNKGGGGGKQPTNGPYHWGNGPQPRGKGCAVLAFLLITGPIAATYSVWELFT